MLKRLLHFIAFAFQYFHVIYVNQNSRVECVLNRKPKKTLHISKTLRFLHTFDELCAFSTADLADAIPLRLWI